MQLKATLELHLTEGLNREELELLATCAKDEGRTIEQIIMDAIRAKIIARRPESSAIAA
jgi:hypothetical protein